VFATLKGLAALLEAPVQSPSTRAALNSGLASGLAALDQAAERVLQERARMGAHLQELDSLGDLVSGLSLQHEQELSRLGDLDYAEAITRFSAQQAALQAAQQSFLRVSSLSLFEQL
jgi:flagellar hook-associated protein 3 FlgL